MAKRLENAGGGDCLFYAIAGGLIEAIQNASSDKAKELWDCWVREGKITGVTFEEIKKISLNDDTFKNNEELMKTLQLSLREIAANTIKASYKNAVAYEASGQRKIVLKKVEEELKKYPAYNKQDKKVDQLEDAVNKKLKDQTASLEKLALMRASLDKERQQRDILQTNEISRLIKKRSSLTKNSILHTSIYNHFEMIVGKYKKNPNLKIDHTQDTLDDKLNIFNQSDDMHDLAKKAAIEINKTQRKGSQEEDYLMKIINENTGIIFKAVDQIKQPGVWGCQENAAMIFNQLQVNHRINTGDVQHNSSDKPFPDAPTIELNNEGNQHWTTQINDAPVTNLIREAAIKKSTTVQETVESKWSNFYRHNQSQIEAGKKQAEPTSSEKETLAQSIISKINESTNIKLLQAIKETSTMDSLTELRYFLNVNKIDLVLDQKTLQALLSNPKHELSTAQESELERFDPEMLEDEQLKAIICAATDVFSKIVDGDAEAAKLAQEEADAEAARELNEGYISPSKFSMSR